MIRALVFLMVAPAAAGAFSLQQPLDCTLGDDCFIQQYFDHDPGPGAQDHACGTLSYDGHDGTDFALPSLRAMQAGVPVRAAAAGTVTGLRDGMPDIAFGAPGAPPLDGRDCGNGVVLDHGDGWQTQYCHLRQGSIRVTEGQQVQAGHDLGLVGLSGRSQFPHLHLSLRQNGRDVDPFAPAAGDHCGPARDTLWQQPLAYQAGGIITLGLADHVPEYEAIKAGTVAPLAAPGGDALVIWAYYFGSRAGDRLHLRIEGADGAFVTETLTLDRTQAQAFRAAGRRLGGADWPTGPLTGTATLIRDGTRIDEARIRLDF